MAPLREITKPSARRRRWSRIETVAWIAYRRFDFVERAAMLGANTPKKRKNRRIDPFSRLVAVAAAQPLTKPALRIAAAERLLHCLERRKRLDADANGEFNSLAVRKAVPSNEGRGKGQQPRPNGDYENIAALGWYLLTTPPEGVSFKQVHERCLKERDLLRTEAIARGERPPPRFPSRYVRFVELRKEAFAWAERELEARERAGIGVAHWKCFSQTEIDRARRNIERWQSLIRE